MSTAGPIPLQTVFAKKCLATLQHALEAIAQTAEDSVHRDIYRAACVKEFEIVLEQCGKLLKKTLRAYVGNPRQIDELNFKDVFRHGALHGLLSLEQSERWLIYRDNRNDTAHDYGENFANETLKLLPQFIQDAKALLNTIETKSGD